MNWTVTIVGMAVVTYFTKAAILLLGERITLSPGVRQALGFVPICVLTAIIVPDWHNPQLVGALAALTVSVVSRHMLLTIGAGLAVFFSWQLFVLA
ncbi:MAG: AzlD domain-containing protein [Rhodospirillaceae bacterium]|nr:AzlD domain-containing protein [Rhodospirillaceae bacterium]